MHGFSFVSRLTSPAVDCGAGRQISGSTSAVEAGHRCSSGSDRKKAGGVVSATSARLSPPPLKISSAVTPTQLQTSRCTCSPRTPPIFDAPPFKLERMGPDTVPASQQQLGSGPGS